MADTWSTLPDELQVQILEHCDSSTLAALCQTYHEMLHKARLVIWTNIDFGGPWDYRTP